MLFLISLDEAVLFGKAQTNFIARQSEYLENPIIKIILCKIVNLVH